MSDPVPTPASRPKVHHYVPKLLLRGFLIPGRTEQVYAFDKRDDRTFATNIRNAAAETGFHDFTVGGEAISAEELMGEVEAEAAPLVRRIVQEESIAWLSGPERSILSRFVAVQLTRTRNFREMLRQAHVGVAEALERRGEGRAALPTEDMLAALQVHLSLTPDELAELVFAKTWTLLRNSTGSPYYVSDNPVALRNSVSTAPGCLGLDTEGVEIYLPLSSRLTLSMICRSYEATLRFKAEAARILRARDALTAELAEDSRQVAELLAAIDQGTPLEQSAENVVNQNSLQVMSAARYLYAADGAFDLAREMLRDEPELRLGGPEMAVEDLG